MMAAWLLSFSVTTDIEALPLFWEPEGAELDHRVTNHASKHEKVALQESATQSGVDRVNNR